MEYTFLDYFNYYLKRFVSELTTNFPDAEKNLVANYRELLEGRAEKSEIYVKYFISRVNDYMELIGTQNPELFNPAKYVDAKSGVVSSLVLIEGVNMLELWNSTYNNDENKANIWKYLQLLVLFGRRVVPNNTEVMDILNSVGGQVAVPAKVEKTLHGKPDDVDGAGNAPDMLGLGGLASLAGMMGIGSGSMPDLSGIVKTLGETLGNLDMSGLVSEMEKAQDEAVSSMDGATPDGTSAETSASAETSSNAETSSSDNSATGPKVPSLFTDLAKEMAETFDFNNLEGQEPPKNIGEAFQKFMSGDNPAKLMGLVSKFGNKLQGDIAKGKVNHADLLKETMGMMSGVTDAEKMKKQAQAFAKSNPAAAEQLRKQQLSSSAGGKTQDRLKAKLAAREQQNKNE